MCNVKGHASMQSGRLFALYGKACHANQKKEGGGGESKASCECKGKC